MRLKSLHKDGVPDETIDKIINFMRIAIIRNNKTFDEKFSE
jgi:hypothetical protein